MAIDGAKGLENGRITSELGCRAIADFFDGKGERSAVARAEVFCRSVGLIDGIFDGTMQGDFEAEEFVGAGGAEIDGGGSAFGNGVDAGAAVDGAEVESGAGFFRQRSVCDSCERRGERGDGVGSARIGEAVPPGAVDGDLAPSRTMWAAMRPARAGCW
jgi:hypothetical protein